MNVSSAVNVFNAPEGTGPYAALTPEARKEAGLIAAVDSEELITAGPSAWVKLGSYYFKGNGKESVVIKSEEGNAPARTSAVKFVFGGKQ